MAGGVLSYVFIAIGTFRGLLERVLHGFSSLSPSTAFHIRTCVVRAVFVYQFSRRHARACTNRPSDKQAFLVYMCAVLERRSLQYLLSSEFVHGATLGANCAVHVIVCAVTTHGTTETTRA